MIYGIFIVFLVLCLFSLFSLSRNDLVIIRQNVSLPSLFDKAIIILLFSYITGRLFFILESHYYGYFDVIKFFYIFRLPGLSLPGTFLGILLALGFLFRNKKNVSRIFDIFILSMFPLVVFAITIFPMTSQYILIKIAFFFVGILFFTFLFNLHKNYAVRDGSVSILSMLFVVLLWTALNVLSVKGQIQLFSFVYIEGIFFLVVLLILFIINQKVLKKK